MSRRPGFFLFSLGALVVAGVLILLNASVVMATTYGSPQFIDYSEDNRGLAWSPQRKIAADSTGNLYVVYRKKDSCGGSFNYQTFVSKSSDEGATWNIVNNGSPVACVPGVDTSNHQRTGSIAIGSDDVIHVVWYGAYSGTSEPRVVFYTKSADGGATWTDHQEISNTGTDTNEHPMVAVDPLNPQKVYVTWDGSRYTRSTDGGNTWASWAHWGQVTSVTGSRAAMVVLGNGDVWAMSSGMFVSKSSDGGVTWTPRERISDSGYDARYGSIIRDSADNVHVVWRSAHDGSPDRPQIRYSMYDGISWSTPVSIDHNPTVYQLFPSITRDANDNLYVAYIETTEDPGYPSDGSTDFTDGQVHAVEKPVGGTWGSKQRIGSTDIDLYPNYIYDDFIQPGDNLHLVYSEGVFSGGVEMHVKYVRVIPEGGDPGGDTTPPTVSITSPQDGATVSGIVTVTADASDNVGVAQVEFFVDGAGIGVDSDGSDGWSASWDTTAYTDGGYSVAAQATDTASLTASHSIAVTVNNSTGSPFDMYVWEMTWSERQRGRGGSMTDLTVTVDVNEDSNADGLAEAGDNPAKNAAVTLLLTHDTDGDGLFEPGSGDDSWMLQGSITGQGTAEFTLKDVPDGSYQAQVTDMTHETLVWNSALDADNPDQYFNVPGGNE